MSISSKVNGGKFTQCVKCSNKNKCIIATRNILYFNSKEDAFFISLVKRKTGKIMVFGACYL